MSLTKEVGPKQLQEAVQRGFDRFTNFRAARLHFLNEYSGPYYDRNSGEVGSAALNLIFNAVRVLVPTMVMNFPKHTVISPYLQQRQYAELLGLALDQHDMKIDIRNVYRRVIVDAIFTLGILKTGLAQSTSVYAIDDLQPVDAGTIYTEAVDFDNFVVDPNCKEHMFRDASFMGDRITIPRQMLLESGLYKNDLIERLPRAGDTTKRDRAYSLSMRNIQADDNYELEDEVEIVELWVPSANAIVTVPGTDAVSFDDYLRVDDYYGVKEGPYTLLSLTPPVPGNPLPVPMVGVWYDLHVLANRMAKKIVEQAERQKDVVSYRRAASEDAEELKNASDGESVAVEDPTDVQVLHFGGQQNSNEIHLAQLQGWFNQMAANVEQTGGQNVQANSATAANILQQNASIGLEDMKDLIYQMAAGEARRRAWYFHTDPMMQIPLTKRQQVQTPMQIQTPTGPTWMLAPVMQDVQVILTPEIRSGDFLDFNFNIEPESMGRRDSKVRLQQLMTFCQQILPAVMGAAQIGMSLGIPISAVNLLMRAAKDMGIEWMDEVLYDPQFQQMLLQQQMMGPQEQNSKGQLGPPGQPNASMNNQVMQNGQPASVQGAPPSGQQQFNQTSQAGAEDAQRMIRGVLNHATAVAAPPKTAPLLQ